MQRQTAGKQGGGKYARGLYARGRNLAAGCRPIGAGGGAFEPTRIPYRCTDAKEWKALQSPATQAAMLDLALVRVNCSEGVFDAAFTPDSGSQSRQVQCSKR